MPPGASGIASTRNPTGATENTAAGDVDSDTEWTISQMHTTLSAIAAIAQAMAKALAPLATAAILATS